MARRRGSNSGKFAENAVKAFLMARKQFAAEDVAEARKKYYAALEEKARGANSGGMSPEAFSAHVRSGGASGASPGGQYGADRGGGRVHAGVDWPAPNGSPAQAAIDGKVVYVGSHSGYGNTVDVLGSDGHVHRYALHEGRVGVKVGDEIAKGQQIGTVGGRHVHNEIIRNGSDAWKASTSGQFGQTSRVGGRSEQTLNATEYYRERPDARVTAGGRPATRTTAPPERSDGSLRAYGMPRDETTGAVPAQRPAEAPAEKPAESAIPAAPRAAPPPAFLDQPLPRTSEVDAPRSTDVAQLESAPPADEYDQPAPVDTAALPPEFFPEDYSVFAAEGGMIDQPTSASLPEVIGAALKATQAEYGLDQEQAALPGTDATRQQNLEAFARNEGATPPEEMEQLLRSVDPQGQMPPGAAAARAMQELYGHYSQQGDPEMGAQAASQVLQATRARSMKLGALAMAALQSGDYAGAGKALVSAYNQIPDGKIAEGQVDQRGNGVVVIKDDDGRTVQEMRVSPQMLQIAADRLMSGSEFYSHMAQLAGPSRPAPGPGGGQTAPGAIPVPQYEEGGAVEDDDAIEDRATVQDAAELQRLDAADEADIPAAGAQPVSNAREVEDAPEQPSMIPYHPQMNAVQRREVDRINSIRQSEWKAEYGAWKQDRRQATSARNQQAQQARSQAFTQQQANARTEYTAQQAREREAMRQRGEEQKRQRQQYNGMTEDDMRQEYARSAAGAVPAVALQADVAQRADSLKQPALPVGVTGGEGGYRNPVRTMQMPDAANRPRSVGDIRTGIQNSFNREFALTPDDRNMQIAARDMRDRALEERDLTAADIAARSSRKDRGAKLEDTIDEIFDARDTGLFTRAARAGEQAGEGGRVYFGDKVPPGEVASMKTWTFKLAQANPDLPISSAAKAVMALTAVDENDPRMLPNYTVKVDDKGRGRVQLRDGSLAFNLDRESLQQIALARRAKVLGVQEKLARAAGDAEAAKKLSQERQTYWGPVLDSLGRDNVFGRFSKDIGAPAADAVGSGLRATGRFLKNLGPRNPGALPDLSSGPTFQ